MPTQMNRVDTLLAGAAAIPTFLARRTLSIGDAIETGLVILIQFRLLLSITGYIPDKLLRTLSTVLSRRVAVLVVINVLAMYVPALRRRF